MVPRWFLDGLCRHTEIVGLTFKYTVRKREPVLPLRLIVTWFASIPLGKAEEGLALEHQIDVTGRICEGLSFFISASFQASWGRH